MTIPPGTSRGGLSTQFFYYYSSLSAMIPTISTFLPIYLLPITSEEGYVMNTMATRNKVKQSKVGVGDRRQKKMKRKSMYICVSLRQQEKENKEEKKKSSMKRKREKKEKGQQHMARDAFYY